MKRLYVGINFHKNWFYSVGNRVTRVVDIVEELNKVPRKDVVVVIGVGRVPPAETEKYRKRGAKTEEIFNPEYQPSFCCPRLWWLGAGMPMSSWSLKIRVLLPFIWRARHLN